MKEDSQDSLLTEMALDLQQPQILTVKSSLIVHEGPEVTAADLTLAPLVTLSSTLPKLEPDDSRLVMNLTTQIHDSKLKLSSVYLMLERSKYSTYMFKYFFQLMTQWMQCHPST